MNRIINVITILLLFIDPTSYGQDTTYYTNDGLKLLTKEKADYYEVTKEVGINSSEKEVCAYYSSGIKKSSKTIIITNNYFVISKKAKPIWGIDGKYQEWFENGKLKMTVKYSKGNRVAQLRTYWENGKVKRIDNYEDDEQLFPYEKFINGKCYNEVGKKIAYFPYYQAAKFPGGPDSMKVFISRNIKNDLTDSLNVTNVRFFINGKGEIINVKVNRNNGANKTNKNGNVVEVKNMEAEAIRVVSSMPNWNPALVDGEPVGEYVNKDISFGKILDKDGIYTEVEKMPQYKGGESALLQHISQNIKYPVLAFQNKISGKVIVRFVVTKTGKMGEVRVLRGIGGGCDEEAVRVIKNLSDWIPGTQNGVPVNVYYILPITFRFQ